MRDTFAKNQTLVALHGKTATIRTDAWSLGEMNYVSVALNIETLIGTGAGTPTVSYLAEGSEDGATWFDFSQLAKIETSTGATRVSAAVRFSLIRIKAMFSINGSSAGDWGATTFDLIGDLIKVDEEAE